MNDKKIINKYSNIIEIVNVNVFPHHYNINYMINKKFNHVTDIYYNNKINLTDMDPILSKYIALIETLKFMIIFPGKLDISMIDEFIDPSFISIFTQLIPKLWNQHIFENDKHDWKGPEIVTSNKKVKNSYINVSQGNKILVCNGGGKDSLLVSKLIELANIKYSTFGHSRTEYGKHSDQHYYQNLLSNELNRLNNYEVKVYDTITDGIFVKTYFPELKGECIEGRPCQVGTPEMLFYCLPYLIKYKYNYIALGWEKSSSLNQNIQDNSLYVNHQWLKSLEAEKEYNKLMGIITNNQVTVFSPIRDFTDKILFNSLHNFSNQIMVCHSCNIQKPWCLKCPKCFYIWLHYLNIFPINLVKNIFKHTDNYFIDKYPDIFRDLLGMNNLNAFECIGDTDYTCYVFSKIISKKIIQFDILPEDIRSYISNLSRSIKFNNFDDSININNLLINIPIDLQDKFRKSFNILFSKNTLKTNHEKDSYISKSLYN